MPIAIGGGKQFAYEVDLKIPFLARGPGVPAGRVNNGHIVGNVDLPATIMEIAGLRSAASAMDGRSLLPLMRGQTPSVWRQSYPLVKYRDPRQTEFPPYVGVRTDRYTWVEWTNGERELYDHVQDPHNLNNLANVANLAGVRSTLSTIADRLSNCAGQACRNIENGAPRKLKGRGTLPSVDGRCPSDRRRCASALSGRHPPPRESRQALNGRRSTDRGDPTGEAGRSPPEATGSRDAPACPTINAGSGYGKGLSGAPHACKSRVVAALVCG
jgi:hypothetical protein